MTHDPRQRTLIIVTGMSGSGKSVALNTLEDLDFFCIDNLPSGLVESTLDYVERHNDPVYDRLALGLDVRSSATDLDQLPALLARLRQRPGRSQILFLTADDATLIKRYSETRRKHPLESGARGIARAIIEERALLHPVRSDAQVVLDTSSLSIHQLRRAICDALGFPDQPLILLVESFAFKQGVPPDLDFAFDARCLPNPHWDLVLRPLTGREPAVREFLDSHQEVRDYVNDVCQWLERWLPQFEAQQRPYLTVGIGCTGGKHRSVYIADRVAEHFLARRPQVLTFHRELL